MDKIKELAVRLSVWFDSLPDPIKKAFWYLLSLIVVQLLEVLQGKFSPEVTAYQVIGIIAIEVAKWGKKQGVEINDKLNQ